MALAQRLVTAPTLLAYSAVALAEQGEATSYKREAQNMAILVPDQGDASRTILDALNEMTGAPCFELVAYVPKRGRVLDAPPYGFVEPTKPGVVHVRDDLVVALGKAYADRLENDACYRRHVLFVAAIIAHEAQHAIRAQSVAREDVAARLFTPPNIRHSSPDRKAYHEESTGRRRVVWSGEGGFWWERNVLGGEIVATEYEKPKKKFDGRIKQLWMRVDKRFHRITDAAIADRLDSNKPMTDVLTFSTADTEAARRTRPPRVVGRRPPLWRAVLDRLFPEKQRWLIPTCEVRR
ncbi:hypothetical protein Q5752_004358 [Cryptotrichosporon argae]